MAYQVMTSRDPPPYVTIFGGSSSQQNNSAGLAPWKIALIVIFVGLLLPGLAMYLFYRRKKVQIHAWIAARKGGEGGGASAAKEDTPSATTTIISTEATEAALPSHLSGSVSTVNVAGHGVLTDKDPALEKTAAIDSRSESPVPPSNKQLSNSIESL